MKKIVLVVVLSFGASGALGQSRPDSTQLPCSAVAGIVQRDGAAIIGTGTYIYDRYVRDQSVCFPTQTLKPAWIQSRDQAQCFVGYTCREHDRNGSRG